MFRTETGRHSTRLRPRAPGLLAAIAAVGLAGCVERRMTVRTNPSNALVVLDGQEVGFSPVSVPFTYYGDRQIRLIKDGYETKTINQTIATPWYQYFPLDFVSEVLYPGRIRDERNYLYQLEPQTMVSNDQLLLRAAELREAGRNPPADVVRRAGLEPSAAPLPPSAASPAPPINSTAGPAVLAPAPAAAIPPPP